jgi:eukaryotic-like serine/threonine-protein kinase
MQLLCPMCSTTITANPPKAGRFTPKCPKCEKAFVVTVTVQTVADYKAAQEKARPSTPSHRHDPDATFASQASGQVEHDPDSTFATQAPAPVRQQHVDPDATFASQANARPVVHDPDSTFASQAKPYDDPDQTEATGGYFPRPAANDDVDKTNVVSVPGNKKTEKTNMPSKLGGYEILKQLGQGGMGAVYLSRQMSLDRSVALKVMNAEWASDPVFVSRFVREAYAAAQLTHHNVVQIYELGLEQQINYFSMEFVDGKSLGDQLKKRGRIPATEAVGYVIQAARGLKFAHDRGMVHRDIKPDNLMLNNEGIVKVADLGLVKTRGMTAKEDAVPEDGPMEKSGSALSSLPDVTRVGSAMGSPSYIAPEQCRDATTVDGRADIYSLGCSLYALLAGRAPYTGNTAIELITKHLNEPVPPIRNVAPDIHKDLAKIVEKTLAKNPTERYQSMEEFITELKGWQDGQSNGPPRATEEQLTSLEWLTKQLTVTNKVKLPRLVAFAAPILGIVLALLFLPFSLVGTGTLLLATVSGVVAGFITTGMLTNSYSFTKAREWAFGAKWTDWLTLVVVVLFFALGLYLAGFLVFGIVGLLLGTGAGMAYAYFLAKPAHDHRTDTKEEIEKLTKRLRLNGMEEESVRLFVIENTGDQWENIFEALYGYPAKMQARQLYAEKVSGKPKYNPWQEALVSKFEGLIESRKQTQAKKLLRQMEVKRLKAQGVSEAEATARAEDAADDLVEQGKDIKKANNQATANVNVGEMMTKYEKAKPEVRPRKNPLVVLLGKMLRFPFDPRLRLVLGALLIVGGVMWINQNTTALTDTIPSGEQIRKAEDVGAAATSAWGKIAPLILDPANKSRQLQLTFVPDFIAGFFHSINPIIAGALLLLSALSSRTRTLLAVVFGAMLAFLTVPVLRLLGIDLPDVGPLKPAHLTGIAGIVIGVLGFFLLGRK